MTEAPILQLVRERTAEEFAERAYDFGLQEARQHKITRFQRQLGSTMLLRQADRPAPLINPNISLQSGGTTMVPCTYRDGTLAGHTERAWYGSPWLDIDDGQMQVRYFHHLFQSRRELALERPDMAIYVRPRGIVSSGRPAFHFIGLPQRYQTGGNILHDDQPLPLSSGHWDDLEVKLDQITAALHVSPDDPRWLAQLYPN